MLRPLSSPPPLRRLPLIGQPIVETPSPLSSPPEEFFLAPVEVGEGLLTVDEAVAVACKSLDLPVLGGPSGFGWSYYNVAQRCMELWRTRYLAEPEPDAPPAAPPAEPLQIGSLFHALQALNYGAAIGPGVVGKGFIGVEALSKRGRPRKTTTIPPESAERLLAELLRMCRANAGPRTAPSEAVVLEAGRLYEAHTNAYDRGGEDFVPLAVEWFAEHPDFPYTCRFDMVVNVGDHDPMIPPGVAIIERKTARMLTKGNTEGWWMDGEILGQLMVWKAAGLDKVFGPLRSLVIDIVTKEKIPKTMRVVIPPEMGTVRLHERAMRQLQAEMNLAQASSFYPRSTAHCFEQRGGRYERVCERWDFCKNA